MRTVCRQTRALNPGKATALRAVVRAYAAEKRHWLDHFARREYRPLLLRHRQVRDAALKSAYAPKSGLQARMWKLALVDAAQTWDKYWKALFAEVRSRVGGRKDFDAVDRHYAFWLLAGYGQFFACLDGLPPEPTFAVPLDRRIRVMHYLQRQIRKWRGRSPRVRLARSAVFDANCYTEFEEKGTQYVKVMGLKPGKRIVVPLQGRVAISGNIRLVLDADGTAALHTGFGLHPKANQSKEVVALDTGYTEAFVDTKGTAYGTGLGAVITQASDERHTKGQARNKLRVLAEKVARKHPAKARRIRKFNLGNAKWNRREGKARATLDRKINTGINEVIRTRQPGLMVTEDLRHAFTSDRPKQWNRRLSAWVRGTLQERMQFKASAEGFRHEQVNAAYSSQGCPQCDYVDKGNRKGDQFVCLHCGHEDQADRVGAVNTERRLTDREITRYTPYREVKAILQSRFQRRLEARAGAARASVVAPACATVPGRTPETVPQPRPRAGKDIGQTRSLGERNKPTNVPVGALTAITF